jgi:hypothetical protein
MGRNELNVRCENCGQPALSKDRVCFYCGTPLPGRESFSDEEVNVRDGWKHRASPGQAIFYLGMTFFLIIATLCLMIILGQKPIVQVGFTTREPENWQDIVVQDQSFLMVLPPAWQWYDDSAETTHAELDTVLAQDQTYASGMKPLGELTTDWEIKFLARETDTIEQVESAFLIVGSSQRLKQLSPEEAMEILATNDLVSEANLVDNFDKSHLSVIVELPLTENGDSLFLCRQQYVSGEMEAYLMSLCAPSQRYLSLETTLSEVYESFQILDK